MPRRKYVSVTCTRLSLVSAGLIRHGPVPDPGRKVSSAGRGLTACAVPCRICCTWLAACSCVIVGLDADTGLPPEHAVAISAALAAASATASPRRRACLVILALPPLPVEGVQ